jgi:DNA-binding response OmpR family regulator
MKINGGKYKILLVEDDLNLGYLLSEFLEENDFEVKLCRDGESGIRAWASSKFDFCIFDVMLPKLDGYSLTRKIRQGNKQVPILLLTAKSLKEDKIYGFKLGVDDYLTKPFDEDELLCRINAIMSRTSKNTETDYESIYKIGKYTFDFQNQLLNIDTKMQRLTKTENQILLFLCRSNKKIAKREDILNEVWGNSDYFTGRSLDVFITKLRKFLKDDPKIRIVGIPTVGYILSDT